MSLPPRRPAKPPRHAGSPRPSQRRPRPQVEPTTSSTAEQRLQKVLAAAGVASRRECEERILQGRVEVDRQVVTELGLKVDPETQEIRVDGQVLPRPKHVYFLVHKPMGVVSTNRDPARRMRVIDLVPEETRMFTVGRLDRNSEGLILVTNDGELANQLTHPRYGISKTYRAQVLGFPTPETLQKLRKGVHLAEGVARVAELKARGRHSRGAELELVLTEGRNREIRRVLARVGHKVLRLRRIAMGPLKLGTLQPGESRRLTPAEVQALRHCVRDQKAQSKKHAPAIETEPLHLSDFDTGSNEEGRRSSPAARPRGATRPAARPPAGGAGRGPKRSERPGRSERPSKERPSTGRPSTGRPSTGRPSTGRPGRPGSEGRGGARPPKPGAVLGYEPAPPTTDEPRPARPPRPPRPPRAPRQRTKARPAKAAGRRAVGRKMEGKRRRPS